jgi:bifunctional UDP-N-acetylglucosamine pyrophosphorylase/glucosamine-1-phosphate N-acetyltransferase
MSDFCSLILAAGEGKRMKLEKPKVLAEILFKPMIKWVIDAVVESGILDICVVTGHQHEVLEKYLSNLDNDFEVVYQKEQKGTAHAVLIAMEFLEKMRRKDILIVSGDSPFIDPFTIKNAYSIHKNSNNAATIISAELKDPFGYGRVKRENGNVSAIVEHKDADEEISKITEVNSGAYWFKVSSLIRILPLITNNNLQSEYYLPDAIGLLLAEGENVGAYKSPEEHVIWGANDQQQLQTLNQFARQRILKKWLEYGVRIPQEKDVRIGPDVVFEKSCTLLPGCVLKGHVIVKEGSILGPDVSVSDCTVFEICDSVRGLRI